MNQNQLKQAVARTALDYIKPKLNGDSVIGIGTGSTANYFIDYLAEIKADINLTVASSEASASRLDGHGIPVCELNAVDEITVYVDGADEANAQLELIKGGGAALTREKIVAAAAKEFVCIADESKYVKQLGQFPLPVEVIPMAQNYVIRQLEKLGGRPVCREGVITDNGNLILDVFDFPITDAVVMEQVINNIAGVVSNGIFARRPADILFLASVDGIKTLKKTYKGDWL